MTPTLTTEALNPRQRGSLVQALGSALWHGGTALGDVPALLKRILREEAWREFETATHETVQYERFAEFLATPPSKGLGAGEDLVWRMVKGDPEAETLLADALHNQRGGDRKSVPYRESQQEIKRMGQAFDSTEAHARTGEVIRRLHKDFPVLHREVLAGNKSWTVAAVEAGITPRRIKVRVDDIPSCARTLRKYLNSEELAELVRHLTGGTE